MAREEFKEWFKGRFPYIESMYCKNEYLKIVVDEDYYIVLLFDDLELDYVVEVKNSTGRRIIWINEVDLDRLDNVFNIKK